MPRAAGFFAVMQGIERPELRDLLVRRGFTHQLHVVDGVDVKAVRAAAVGHHRVRTSRMFDADRIGLLLEQIDHGRAMQAQVLRLQVLEQTRGVRIAAHVFQHQMQRQTAHRHARRQAAPQCRQVDVEEVEFLGKAEVLGQQPIGGMRACRAIDQGLVFAKADFVQGHGNQPLPDAGALGFHVSGCGVQEQRIAQRRHERRLAVHVDAQLVHRQRFETAALADVFQRDGDRAGRTLGQLHSGRRRHRALERRRGNAHRRKRDVVRGAEAAFDLAHHACGEERAARNRDRRAELRSHAAHIEMRHRARRKGPQIVRIQHLQQRLGKFGVVVVELLADPCGQEGKRFDHPLDMRIVAAVARHGEAAGDLRIPLGEVARVPAQEGQFSFVIRQQLFHSSWRSGGGPAGASVCCGWCVVQVRAVSAASA